MINAHGIHNQPAGYIGFIWWYKLKLSVLVKKIKLTDAKD